jgi:hypothetical protein
MKEGRKPESPFPARCKNLSWCTYSTSSKNECKELDNI